MRKSQVQQYKIWNEAIETVRARIVLLGHGCRLTDDQHLLLSRALHVCDSLALSDDLVRWKPNVELARKYACSPRTITNWRSAGAPLFRGQWRMLDWLARQHSLPKRTEERFAKQLARRRSARPLTYRTMLREARQMAQLAKLLRARHDTAVNA